MEEPLVHPVRRSIVEPPLLPFFDRAVFSLCRIDHHELVRHTSSFCEEPAALVGEQVAIEVTREHSCKLAIRERKRNGFTLNRSSARNVQLELT